MPTVATPNTTTLTQYMISNMSNAYMNPSSFEQIAINGLTLALGGADIVDATNPMIFTLETGMCAAAVAIAKSDALTRKQYPYLSQTIDDLFTHMSDNDYIGVFGTGSECTIQLLIPYNTLLNNAAFLTSGSNVKTVIIPRDTQISVNNITLEIGYPVVINCLPGNLIQVYYDTSITNPLINFTDNAIPYSLVNFQNTNYLQIQLPVVQVASFTNTYTISNVSSFYQTIALANDYCYAAAYYLSTTGNWVPMATTFSSVVYDTNTPTMVLSVNGGNLIATLPDIYQSYGTVGSNIRLDVFTTQGALDIDLTQVSYQNFSATWTNFDQTNIETNVGVAAFASINDILISAVTALTGGANPLTFTELYNKVIYRYNAAQAPIRPTDIISALSAKGYAAEILYNNVSTRTYLAVQNLPPDTANGISASPLALNASVLFNPSNYSLDNLNSLTLISHASERSTILPSALYQLQSGSVSVLTDNQTNAINSLTGLNLCNALNTNTYLNSPFHYVMDYSNSVFVARAYYLQAPTVPNRTFVNQNLARTYNLATMSTVLTFSSTGFNLQVTTSIPANLSEVLCQLSYTDPVSGNTIYLNASSTVQSSQAIFNFAIDTDFDINVLNQINLTNFVTAHNVIEPLMVPLTTTFNLFYLIPGSNVSLTTVFDGSYVTPHDYLTTGVIGATQETITLNFGQYLPNLYCPVIENLTAGETLSYGANVPATYPVTIYEEGPEGPVFTIDNLGNINLTILHNAGDPILDSSGQPKMLHYLGDPVLDINGIAIPVSNYTNGISYTIGVTLIDAKYSYATATLTKAYTSTLPDFILGFMANDIASIANELSENTKIWYAPAGESFLLNVNLGNGITAQVPGIINVQITVYMNNDGMTNLDLQAQTTLAVNSVVGSQLSLTTLTTEGLGDAIEAVLPSQAITFSIDSFLPNNAPIITLLDNTQTFTLGSVIAVMPNNTLDIVEGITVLYKSST
jgi:hypothetical protein